MQTHRATVGHRAHTPARDESSSWRADSAQAQNTEAGKSPGGVRGKSTSPPPVVGPVGRLGTRRACRQGRRRGGGRQALTWVGGGEGGGWSGWGRHPAAEPPGRRTAGGGGGRRVSGAAFPLPPPPHPPSPGAILGRSLRGASLCSYPAGLEAGETPSAPSTSRVLREQWLGGRGAAAPWGRGWGRMRNGNARTAPAQTGSPCPGGCMPSRWCTVWPSLAPAAKPVCLLTFMFGERSVGGGCSLRLSFSPLLAGPVPCDLGWLRPQASFLGCAWFEKGLLYSSVGLPSRVGLSISFSHLLSVSPVAVFPDYF